MNPPHSPSGLVVISHLRNLSVSFCLFIYLFHCQKFFAVRAAGLGVRIEVRARHEEVPITTPSYISAFIPGIMNAPAVSEQVHGRGFSGGFFRQVEPIPVCFGVAPYAAGFAAGWVFSHRITLITFFLTKSGFSGQISTGLL